MKLVAGLDICCFFEHRHQFRQVEELCKTSARTVSGAFWGKFDGSSSFTKSRSPRIKMGQPFLLQGVVLEVAHEGVHLGHTVAQGCTRCKNHATASGDFIQIAALAEHIAGFLRLACAQTCDITHFRVQVEVLKRLALIHKQPVYAQLFKRNHIIFTVCALQLFQFLFQRLAQLFQLLYREMLANLRFRFFDGLLDFIHLFLNQTLLSFCGQGYLFKLAVSDDNCIIITGRNSRTEFFSITGFKIFLAGNQQLRIGVQA